MRSVPNDGLVRFYGFFNREVILVTQIEACKDLLLRDAHKYDKLNSLAALQWPIGVSGLVSAKGALHKARNPIPMPRFPLRACDSDGFH